VHAVAVVRHLDDDRDRGSELRKVFGDAVLIRRHAAVRHGGHPHLDIELRGELPERLHAASVVRSRSKPWRIRQAGSKWAFSFRKLIEWRSLSIVNDFARVVWMMRFSLHLEPLHGKVFEVARNGPGP